VDCLTDQLAAYGHQLGIPEWAADGWVGNSSCGENSES